MNRDANDESATRARLSPTAIVTGASGGIGAAVCAALRAAGYRVIGTDVAPANTECDTFVVADLCDLCRDAAARDAAIARLRSAIDGPALALLVNNAATQILGGAESIAFEQWQRTLDVNLTAPFVLTQALLPELERGHGSVVNVASVHATLTKPGFVAYATSKAALVGLTRSLAVDLGGRVRVNAVLPAATATPMLLAGLPGDAEREVLAGMHPAGRIARPEEIAAAIVYLASPAAGFVTGTALAIDGGVGARLHDPL